MSGSLASAMMKSCRRYWPARIRASFSSKRFMTVLCGFGPRAGVDQAASSNGGGCMAPVMIATASDIE